MKTFIFIFLVLALFAWCPWYKQEEATKALNQKVAEIQSTTANLCPLYVKSETIHKTFFGYSEKIAYDCTMIDKTFGIVKGEDDVLATFLGIVIGVPSKSMKIQ